MMMIRDVKRREAYVTAASFAVAIVAIVLLVNLFME
jgi:hypothetical protein